MTMLKPRSGMNLTVEEFMELPETDDHRKMELDEGVLYIMVKPGLVHQFFQMRLVGFVDQYLEEFEEPPAYVFTEVIVVLSLERRTLFAPDLSIVLAERSHLFTEQRIEGAPDIAVEILSTDRSRDLVRKRQAYADAGVAEYWIFDASNDTATLLGLRDGEYVERAILTADNTLTTPLLPGLSIPLAGIFRHRRRPVPENDC